MYIFCTILIEYLDVGNHKSGILLSILCIERSLTSIHNIIICCFVLDACCHPVVFAVV